jgi:hypothetical protein
MDVALVTADPRPWTTVSVGVPSRVSEFILNSIIGTVRPRAVGTWTTPL